jgi:hypothetical protein
MSAHAVSASSHTATKVPISIPFVVLAAFLVGIGVLGMVYFLITFDLLYLFGALATTVGGLMLFHPLAGADHAG